MEQSFNQILLRGNLYSCPEFSHENHGKVFLRFLLEVPRLSGTSDLLPVIAEKGVMESADISNGSIVSISGQIRTHNQRCNGHRHLLVFVFASSITCESGLPVNDVSLDGIICRPPVFRMTPLGREICDVMLAVPRAFHRSDYLPCIMWGRTAKEVSRCSVGDQLKLSGRFQSRSYTKTTETGIEQKTAYEISALTVQTQFPDSHNL